jgi:formylglycine-generating enzyme
MKDKAIKTTFILIMILFAADLCAQDKVVIEWVSIPAGTFIMGTPEDFPEIGADETQHQVTLSAFKMSKYEITFEQYDIFCNATGRTKPNDEGWGRGKRPVINVSWDDANAFAEWMGCRLPTEAEWEYACRAGTTTTFNTGDCLSTSKANYNGDFPNSGCKKGKNRKKTTPVGSFSPNAWGLFDMHGNISEWCIDWYGEYPLEAQTNPRGTGGGHRVLRGGNWSNLALFCRSAARDGSDQDYLTNGIGFRLVSLN